MSIFKKKEKKPLNYIDENNRLDNFVYLWMGIFMVLGYVLFRLVSAFLGTTVLAWVSLAVIVLLLVSLEYSALKKTTNEKRIMHVVLFIGIILRLYYIIASAQSEYTTDSAAVLQTMQDNMWWPEVQQPLYYLIAGAVSYAAQMISVTASQPMEIVRLVNEYFGIAAMVAVYYIMCELEANDTEIYLGIAIMAVHPGLIIAGGSISTSMLLTMLLTHVILYMVRWNNFTNGYNFIAMSVYLGLAVMTDMRALMFAPVIIALIVINLVRVAKRKQAMNTASTVLTTVVGVLISCALSLIYPIINAINGTLTNPFALFTNIFTNSAEANAADKLFTFNLVELFDVFADAERDGNAWAYLIKTSVFGNYSSSFFPITTMRFFIYLVIALIAVFALMTLFSVFAKMDAKKKQNALSIFGLCVSIIVYYILLNAGSTTAADMSFESIAIILSVAVALFAIGMKVLHSKKNLSFSAGVLYVLSLAVGYAFCISSALYYLLIFK